VLSEGLNRVEYANFVARLLLTPHHLLSLLWDCDLKAGIKIKRRIKNKMKKKRKG